jgi:hypothetical protein
VVAVHLQHWVPVTITRNHVVYVLTRVFPCRFSSVLLLIFSLWYYHFWSRMHGTFSVSFRRGMGLGRFYSYYSLGPFQAAHFYGHVFVLGYSIFLILGFVGFVSSLKFVKYIYGSIKMD